MTHYDNTKFEMLEDDTIQIGDRTLYRIRAKKDFGTVKAGELGGYIENKYNLSEIGDAWVYSDARVYGEAQIYGDAWVYGRARVYGEARVFGNAWVLGNARVYENAEVSGDAEIYGDVEIRRSEDYVIFKNNWSSYRYFTYTKSNKMWKVGCFYGTGQELIEKAYKDSEESGKCYEAYVRLVEQLETITEQKGQNK